MHEFQRAEEVKANMVCLGALSCALAEFVRISEKLEVESTIFWPLRLTLKLVLLQNRIAVKIKAVVLASPSPRRE